MSRIAKGYLIAIIGIVIWSTTGIFIEYLLTQYHMPALLMAFWRNLLVCVALLPALFFIRRSLLRYDPSQTWFYIFYGFVLALFNSIWALSIKGNGAAVATVLGYSSAGFTAIIAFFYFNEKLGLPKIIAVILSLGGCVLVSDAFAAQMWKSNPVGITTGLITGVLFAIYTLYGKEAAKRELNVWTSLLYSFAFSTLFIMIFNFFSILPGAAGSFKALLPVLPLHGWFILIFLAFIPTLFGFGLYNESMNYLSASTTNILATSEPVMTAIEAYIFLNERMTIIQIIGSLIILSAVLIMGFEKE